MKIIKKFVTNYANQDVYKYSLIADNKFQVDVLNYGAIICGVYTPDKNNTWENVILAYDDFNDYITNIGYFGAVVGRHAGRIGSGRFSIDGIEYQVATNRNGNNLHGGNIGLDKRIWQVSEITNGIQLKYLSPHLEEGFPGNIEFTVTYLIDEDNTLTITYDGMPDQKTLINLTNHTSFNLSGGKIAAAEHRLYLNANKFCAVDNTGLVTSEFVAVKNTPFDFTQAKKISTDIASDDSQLKIVGGGYDHPFILNKSQDPQIVLADDLSGRTVQITTTENAVVFYSGNFYTPGGKINHKYYASKHFGVCLETQNIPNAINLNNYADKSLFTATTPYHAETKWRFALG
ncbi:MAG: galactose mutarotase [Burkholderiales bacterium]|nr:galactose mutarotase [Burkholderiales bacterium]